MSIIDSMKIQIEDKEQYKIILNAINDKNNPAYLKKDIYKDLMKIEENVLNTLNRVDQFIHDEKDKSTLKFDMSFYDFVSLFVNNWINIYEEIFKEKQYISIVEIFTKGDRKIFVGTMFIIIALVLLFTFLS